MCGREGGGGDEEGCPGKLLKGGFWRGAQKGEKGGRGVVHGEMDEGFVDRKGEASSHSVGQES